MKQILTCCLFIFLIGAAQAQKEPKGSPPKAEGYLAKDDLTNARAEIDKAITIEKTAAKSDTWLTRGKVYQAIAIGGDDDAIPVAMEAYTKYKEMEPKAASLIDLQNIAGFQGAFFNIASEAYNDEIYDVSLTNFQKALSITPKDSLTLVYVALAAYQNDAKDLTLKYYRESMALDYADVDIYLNAVYIAKDILEDYDAALAFTLAGQEKFPTEPQFVYDEINVYLKTDRQDDALAKLQVAAEMNPENSSVHLQLAMFKDNMAYNAMVENKWESARPLFDEAITHYRRVLEIKNGEDFIVNFNLGVIYVNLAKEQYDQVRDMDMARYEKEGKPLIQKGNEIIKNALPLMEKATQITPDDVGAWQALMQVYTQLKMNDKAEEAYGKVEALEGAEAK